jgi:flagellar basal-body rod protein FlgB
MNWVALRQAVTAENVANADTPGYRAKEASAFEATVERAGLQLATTGPGHMTAPDAGRIEFATETIRAGDESLSGNNVSLETEMLKASQNTRMMSIDTAVTRSFHRMMLAGLKG